MKRQIQYMRAQLNKAEEFYDENKLQQLQDCIQEVKAAAEYLLKEEYLKFIKEQ